MAERGRTGTTELKTGSAPQHPVPIVDVGGANRPSAFGIFGENFEASAFGTFGPEAISGLSLQYAEASRPGAMSRSMPGCRRRLLMDGAEADSPHYRSRRVLTPMENRP